MLGWSISLFRIRGIRLAAHWTFLLLLALVAWEGWLVSPDARMLGVFWSLLYVIVIFTCVVLHELGHSFVARAFGIGVPRILLLPIGGMAEFDSIPRRPKQEIAIALAGPAVNFAIILVLMMFVSVPTPSQLTGYDPEPATVWQYLLVINLVMGCFNLLPVFPMDGGRVLRAVLAMRLPYVRATFWAATVGKVLASIGAVVMAFWAHRPLGAVLFLFIFLAGEMEYRAVKRREEADERWKRILADFWIEPDEAPPPVR